MLLSLVGIKVPGEIDRMRVAPDPAQDTDANNSDGDVVEECRGGRRSLLDRRPGQFENVTLPVQHDQVYYLTTDGYLDQAGGSKGFGLGNSRFRELLRSHAQLPLSEQAELLRQALDEYRGNHAQRDDITLLAFRMETHL